MTIKDINALKIMRGKNLVVRMYITNKVNDVINGSTLFTIHKNNETETLVLKALKELGIDYELWTAGEMGVFRNSYLVCKKGHFDGKNFVKELNLKKITYKV